MRTFIVLATLSDQGMRTLVATPERLLEVNREVEALGGRVRKQWALLGDYDFLSIIEAPDEAVMAQLTASFAARGSARVESMPAISTDEFLDVLRDV